jgi:hypothetical protein
MIRKSLEITRNLDTMHRVWMPNAAISEHKEVTMSEVKPPEQTPPAAQPAAPQPSRFQIFFTSIPGILTAIGGFIAAIAALLGALDRAALLRPAAVASTSTLTYTATPLPSATSTLTLVPSAAATLAQPTNTFTPTVAVTLPPEGVVLMDDFSDPKSGWDTYADADGEASYKDSEYRIVVHAPDTTFWSNPQRKYELSDFSLEVDARRTKGPTTGEYGVIVRYQSETAYYLFTVDAEGSYGARMMRDGKWTQLVEWADSKALRQGEGVNHLRVECLGTHIRFYANGELLTEVEDKTFASGNIGLAAGTFEEGEVEVRFDNLRLQPLKKF